MTTKYIPGPWEAGLRTVRAPETKDWPELNVKIYGCNNSVARPTVRLIAAAPDMLEALKELVELAEPNIYPQPDKPDTPWAKLQRARAAIAKAEGQAE